MRCPRDILIVRDGNHTFYLCGQIGDELHELFMDEIMSVIMEDSLHSVELQEVGPTMRYSSSCFSWKPEIEKHTHLAPVPVSM